MNSVRLGIKNWSDFQHYKDRCPPWIKLHKSLLDDFEYQGLPLASKALAPMLWLLASENIDGSFEGSPERLAFRLRWAVGDIVNGIKPLLLGGFIIVLDGVLAECYHDARPETEAETYKPEAKKRERAPRFDPEKLALPNGLTEEKWMEWVAYRRERKLPLKETTTAKQVEFLGECFNKGINPGDVIDESIRQGWQGLFSPKAAPQGRMSLNEKRAETIAKLTGRTPAATNVIEGSFHVA